MNNQDKKKPFYPLEEVKEKVRNKKIQFTRKALEEAHKCFRWSVKDMKECLLKLNDLYHYDNPAKNHFFKTEENRNDPTHKMDYYKARNILEGNNLYTHLYIKDEKKVYIDSFKELEE